ncbi:MAG TPA: GntR family transcriptional regulator [Advenella sp.]|nr:GntR family transcriptional regulator [Advenella sp.]
MNTQARRLAVFESLQIPDFTKRPKYQRLVDALVDGIRRGIWQPGDQLPAEEELAQITPFSLGTVQRALRDLAEQGLVVRMHGLGSFIADAPRQLEDPWHCRFLDDDGTTVLPIFSQAILRTPVKGNGPWNRYLGVSANIMRLDRIITINDEFKISSRFYADRQLLKRLWEMPMEKLNGANFKNVITQQFKLPITNITHLVQLADFDAESCERVGVPHPYHGVYMQAIARAGRECCVYYQEFFLGPTTRSLQFPEANLSSG